MGSHVGTATSRPAGLASLTALQIAVGVLFSVLFYGALARMCFSCRCPGFFGDFYGYILNLVLLTAFSSFILAYGYWNGLKWTRRLGLVVTGIAFLIHLMYAYMYTVEFTYWYSERPFTWFTLLYTQWYIGIFVEAGIFYYLTRSKVKAFFVKHWSLKSLFSIVVLALVVFGALLPTSHVRTFSEADSPDVRILDCNRVLRDGEALSVTWADLLGEKRILVSIISDPEAVQVLLTGKDESCTFVSEPNERLEYVEVAGSTCYLLNVTVWNPTWSGKGSATQMSGSIKTYCFRDLRFLPWWMP